MDRACSLARAIERACEAGRVLTAQRMLLADADVAREVLAARAPAALAESARIVLASDALVRGAGHFEALRAAGLDAQALGEQLLVGVQTCWFARWRRRRELPVHARLARVLRCALDACARPALEERARGLRGACSAIEQLVDLSGTLVWPASQGLAQDLLEAGDLLIQAGCNPMGAWSVQPPALWLLLVTELDACAPDDVLGRATSARPVTQAAFQRELLDRLLRAHTPDEHACLMDTLADSIGPGTSVAVPGAQLLTLGRWQIEAGITQPVQQLLCSQDAFVRALAAPLRACLSAHQIRAAASQPAAGQGISHRHSPASQIV